MRNPITDMMQTKMIGKKNHCPRCSVKTETLCHDNKVIRICKRCFMKSENVNGQSQEYVKEVTH